MKDPELIVTVNQVLLCNPAGESGACMSWGEKAADDIE